ncbi:MAG TPA: hypothetical protein VHL60_08225 [Oxalicibacterium sp.]|jgi:hypothetical protein|nr:hypothetical protein [Oxalicibacterium sp.]
MAIEAVEQALQEPNAAPAQPELLVSAVLHLMSHYSAHQQHRQESKACIRLASVIERHLKALADLPELAPVLRATCQQLSEQWALMVEKAMPQQERFRLLSRLVIGSTHLN